MNKSFSELTIKELERLRRLPMTVPAGDPGVDYDVTDQELAAAVDHLGTLYQGQIKRSFAAKLLLLHRLYSTGQ